MNANDHPRLSKKGLTVCGSDFRASRRKKRGIPERVREPDSLSAKGYRTFLRLSRR